MTPLTSLVIPVLVSAVLVFVVSSIMHMLLTYHRADWRKLPNEDEVLDTLRRLAVPPGDYAAPYAGGPEAMKQPEFVAKMTKGPTALMTVAAGAPPAMGTALLLWFVYSAVVAFFAGYLASRVLPPGTHYLAVFRVVGTSAFMGYSLALAQRSIWYKQSWATTCRSMFDGLVYALLTAGTFGWLWPR
jgi:hypothetical protein